MTDEQRDFREAEMREEEAVDSRYLIEPTDDATVAGARGGDEAARPGRGGDEASAGGEASRGEALAGPSGPAIGASAPGSVGSPVGNVGAGAPGNPVGGGALGVVPPLGDEIQRTGKEPPPPDTADSTDPRGY